MPQYFRDDLEIDDHVVVYRRAHWDKIGGRARATPGVEAKISPNFFSDYPEDAARKLGYEGPCMSGQSTSSGRSSTCMSPRSETVSRLGVSSPGRCSPRKSIRSRSPPTRRRSTRMYSMS